MEEEAASPGMGVCVCVSGHAGRDGALSAPMQHEGGQRCRQAWAVQSWGAASQYKHRLPRTAP